MPGILLHNPHCSKSRAALALLEEHGCDFEVRRYLDAPLDTAELRELLTCLDLPATTLVRTGEYAWRAQNLDLTASDNAELIAALASNPILLQRPIFMLGRRAVIGRPPERVLELLA